MYVPYLPKKEAQVSNSTQELTLKHVQDI